MEKTHVTQAQLVNQILKIGHGDLSVYADPGLSGARHEPELFAHLIAWNAKRGEVRDSKVALPVIALRGPQDAQLYENAAAHLCLLSPRDLVRATRFHRILPKCNGGAHYVKRAVHAYLKHREMNRTLWDRTVLQHRKSVKTLYATYHIKPAPRAQRILFDRDYPQRSIFAKVRELKNMSPLEAAGTIINNKIPFLIAVGALGGIKDKQDVILALIENMTHAELINNTAALEKWGVFENAALSTAYDKVLANKPAKGATLKAEKAAGAVKGKKAAKKLTAAQEKQLDTKSIEGDWLVLGDRSWSMSVSLDLAREIAGFLARTVKGKVHLVLFNQQPVYFDVTGCTLDEIKHMTRRYSAQGNTSIGCGLDLLREKNLVVNGIAICSDGGENTAPYFVETYRKYVEQLAAEPTVYLWHVPGDSNRLGPRCNRGQIPLEVFEMGRHVDYYSIPQLALTMRTGRYSLIEEILETPLLTFYAVLQ